MREAQVALTLVPQNDGQVKNRPVILLREFPGFRDFLVCGISSQIRHEVKGFDEIISPEDDDYFSSGLLTDSLIRLSFLAVLPQRKLMGVIGEISRARHERLLRKLSQFLVEKLNKNSDKK